MTNFTSKTNKPSSPPPAIPKAAEKDIVSPGELVTQLAFDLKMELINARLDNSQFLLIGVVVVLAIGLITLFYGYWQFASTSFNDYSQKVKELNDQRYDLLLNRIKDLENKNIATQSGS